MAVVHIDLIGGLGSKEIAVDFINSQTEADGIISTKPDMIEVLPGLMPEMIRRICKSTKTPIIAGGLIEDKEAVMAALSAGAIAISTTNPGVWEL